MTGQPTPDTRVTHPLPDRGRPAAKDPECSGGNFPSLRRIQATRVGHTGHARRGANMTAAGKSGALVRALLLVLAIGFLAYAATGIFAYVTHPYQHEFREGAPVVVVKTMLRGENPYSLAQQATATYVYGILYPLLNYPLSRVFGATIVSARIMSWLYVWAAALLIFRFAYRRNRSLAMAAFCTVPFFFTEPFKAGAQPNDLGDPADGGRPPHRLREELLSGLLGVERGLLRARVLCQGLFPGGDRLRGRLPLRLPNRSAPRSTTSRWPWHSSARRCSWRTVCGPPT